jgi:hypothetical protein
VKGRKTANWVCKSVVPQAVWMLYISLSWLDSVVNIEMMAFVLPIVYPNSTRTGVPCA